MWKGDLAGPVSAVATWKQRLDPVPAAGLGEAPECSWLHGSNCGSGRCSDCCFEAQPEGCAAREQEPKPGARGRDARNLQLGGSSAGQGRKLPARQSYPGDGSRDPFCPLLLGRRQLRQPLGSLGQGSEPASAKRT